MPHLGPQLTVEGMTHPHPRQRGQQGLLDAWVALLQAGKQALRLVRSGQGDELRSHAQTSLAALLAGHDHQESVAAFLEKRDPSYEGR